MGKHEVAIFLDRDGTLIRDFNDIVRPAQVRILRNTAPGLALLRKAGFLLVVVSNQPVVGKGLITRRGVEKLHALLNARLAKRGAHIDAFYFCPHRHWDNCACRKPKLGLVRQAAKKYGINLRRSFFIGDDMRDVETGRRGKIKTILVRTGKGGRDKRFYNVKPDLVARDLLDAARIITKHL
ncbi:MAG TPA: HAD family hydrolase [Candidatus Paceibacterota bacterium]|nr:HAD family hydrolase [Candidatus Paceibacterota bacterium]